MRKSHNLSQKLMRKSHNSGLFLTILRKIFGNDEIGNNGTILSQIGKVKSAILSQIGKGYL